jgi:outer membrane protein assembly factor BamB
VHRILKRTALTGFLAILPFMQPAAHGATLAGASSTFQVDSAHDGSISFATHFAPPLKQRWSVDLGGGVSYPVVAGNLVVVLVHGPGHTRMVALDIATGKVVWQNTVLVGVAPSYIGYDKGAVFLASCCGPLTAINASNGTTIWSKRIFPGGSSSNFIPIFADGQVYVGDTGAGTLAQVDEKTGKTGWKQGFAGGGNGATYGGGKIYFPDACAAEEFDAATGAYGWGTGVACWGLRGNGAPVAYYAGRIFGANQIADAVSGNFLDGTGPGVPVFSGTTSYAISGTSLVAANIATGNFAWYLTPADDTFSNPPITINGNVYTLSDTGQLYINNGKTGTLMQTAKLGFGKRKAITPAPLGGLGAGQGTLFVPSGSLLVAFGP